MGSVKEIEVKGSKEAPRRTHAEGRQLIAEYEASGLGRRAFCASRSISVNTLDYWRRRGKPGRATRPPAASEFVELAPIVGAGALDLELELGGGVVLRLRRGV